MRVLRSLWGTTRESHWNQMLSVLSRTSGTPFASKDSSSLLACPWTEKKLYDAPAVSALNDGSFKLAVFLSTGSLSQLEDIARACYARSTRPTYVRLPSSGHFFECSTLGIGVGTKKQASSSYGHHTAPGLRRKRCRTCVRVVRCLENPLGREPVAAGNSNGATWHTNIQRR